MSTFSEAETRACRRLIELALEEDLGTAGDVTSRAVIPQELTGRAALVARAAGVLSGLPAVRLVMEAVEQKLVLEPSREDGDALTPGDRIALVSGPMRGILAAERTALNFLQRLSGVATLTRRFVDAVSGLPVQILDTRKTTPGWRLLEKYAVRCGGGHNHRMGLFDAVLIKDNHLAALGTTSIPRAIRAAREGTAPAVSLVVEVDSLPQLDEALQCRPDVVLLDNMKPVDMREAVRRRDAVAPGVSLEASGGVNLSTVRDIAATGVDRVSVGALTHSAVALDIALDYV